MVRLCIKIFLMLAVLTANATGMPEPIEITPQNAKKLGFELTAEYDQYVGHTRKMTMVYFKFPAKVRGNWFAMRVQTHILDKDGKQITGTSIDSVITDENPSVFAYYQAEVSDMAIHVHYFCKTEGGYGCAEDYFVKSVSNYLITTGITQKN